MSDEIWTKELYEAHIQQGSRVWAQALLARLLDQGPTDDALFQYANKSVDRWAQAVAIVARLAGYHDKLELGGAMGVMDLSRLSDAELQKRLIELRGEMAALPPAAEDSPDGH